MCIFTIIWCLTAYEKNMTSSSAGKVCLHNIDVIEMDEAGVQSKRTSHDQGPHSHTTLDKNGNETEKTT